MPIDPNLLDIDKSSRRRRNASALPWTNVEATEKTNHKLELEQIKYTIKNSKANNETISNSTKILESDITSRTYSNELEKFACAQTEGAPERCGSISTTSAPPKADSQNDLATRSLGQPSISLEATFAPLKPAPLSRLTSAKYEKTKGDKLSNKGGQHADQRGTKGDNKGGQKQIKGGQTRDQRGTKVDCLSEEPILHPRAGAASEKNWVSGPDNPSQRRTKPASTALSPFVGKVVPLLEEVCPPLMVNQRGTTAELVPLLEEVCPPLIRTAKGDKKNFKGGQKKIQRETKTDSTKPWPDPEPVLPTSQQMREIVAFLAFEQDASGLGYTRRTKRADICQQLQIPHQSLKKQISRLCAAQYLRRIDARHGRNRNAGTVYQIHPAVLAASLAVSRQLPGLPASKGDKICGKGGQKKFQTGTTKGDKPPKLDSSSSSKNILNTTTTGQAVSTITREQHQDIDVAIARFTGGELFSANDVAQFWQRKNQPFNSLEALLESLEHVLFYIDSERQQGRKLGKGFVVQTLMHGYYGPPIDFISWQEKQLSIQSESMRFRTMKIKQAKQTHFEAMFDVWFEELNLERKNQLTKGTNYAHASGEALKQRLRSKFVEETGIEDPCL